MRMTSKLKSIDLATARSDEFLTNVFGYPCWMTQGPYNVELVRSDLMAMPFPSFVWLKVEGKKDPSIAQFKKMGFETISEEVTYERPASKEKAAKSSSDEFDIISLSAKKAAGDTALSKVVGDLAANAMTNSRFHQDPSIPPELAADVKRRWIMNFFASKRGQKMIIARAKDGTVIGCNQILYDGTTRVIDLICTSEEWRRKGVAHAMIEAMFEPNKETRVGSQSINKAADKLYRGLGFKPVSTSICMHWHAKDI